MESITWIAVELLGFACKTFAFSKLVVGLLLVLLVAATAAATTSSGTIVLGNDRCTDAFHLLLFFLDFLRISLWIRVEPRLTVLQRILDFFFLVVIKLLTKTLVLARSLCGGAHRVEVPVKRVLRINALLHFFVFVGELLGLLDHFFNLLFREAALIVGDRDGLLLSSPLVFGADVQDTIRIDFEGDFDLGL